MKTLNKMLVISLLVLSGCAMFKPPAPGKPDQINKEYGYLMHEVVKGESAKCLAKKYKISVQEVFTMNPKMDSTKPRKKLIPGEMVKILYIEKK